MVEPLFLTPNLFTDLKRTPWAGERIPRVYKDEVCPEYQRSKIGEAWEFSCDPDYLSCDLKSGRTLAELIRSDPEHYLSPKQVQEKGKDPQVLVKLIHADHPLSLQVHPEDHDQNLKAHECGKPESWLVLDHKKGAGIYLGFKESYSKSFLRDALSSGDDCSSLLQFVPVAPMDYFEIFPGIPHAIGPGVTLLEPQRILAGRSGKTYRMWDWGRCYDHDGQLDRKGKPRELHLDQALQIVDPAEQWGEKLLALVRKKPRTISLRGVKVHIYPENAYYQVISIQIDSAQAIEATLNDGYALVSTVLGRYQLNGQAVLKGQPLFIPAALQHWQLQALERSHLMVIIPSGGEFQISGLT